MNQFLRVNLFFDFTPVGDYQSAVRHPGGCGRPDCIFGIKEPRRHAVPKTLAGLARIAPYVAGESGIEGRENVIKLASNEGPFGPEMETIAALREAAGDYHRYPDGDSREVGEIIATRHNLAFEQVICGCGSDSLSVYYAVPMRDQAMKFSIAPMALQCIPSMD